MSDFNQLPLEDEHEAPSSVKSGVGGNLNFIRFVSEVIDLYVVKAGSSFLGFMSNFEMNEPDNDSTKK